MGQKKYLFSCFIIFYSTLSIAQNQNQNQNQNHASSNTRIFSFHGCSVEITKLKDLGTKSMVIDRMQTGTTGIWREITQQYLDYELLLQLGDDCGSLSGKKSLFTHESILLAQMKRRNFQLAVVASAIATLPISPAYLKSLVLEPSVVKVISLWLYSVKINLEIMGLIVLVDDHEVLDQLNSKNNNEKLINEYVSMIANIEFYRLVLKEVALF
ncbi:MAG: hypothetical protein QE271_08985 [Bacteriovoracaceae bacterium]|nr:hypothetical protein [Bacteriovoracaceae bacterium]